MYFCFTAPGTGTSIVIEVIEGRARCSESRNVSGGGVLDGSSTPQQIV